MGIIGLFHGVFVRIKWVNLYKAFIHIITEIAFASKKVKLCVLLGFTSVFNNVLLHADT